MGLEAQYKKSMMPVLILEILRRKTDNTHRLSSKDISKLIENEYGLKPDRRTITNHLNELDAMGEVISKKTERVNEDLGDYKYDWKINSKIKDDYLRFLIDQVLATPYVQKNEKESILKAIHSLGSEFFNKTNQKVVEDTNISNVKFFDNLKKINLAIQESKTINFHYSEFTYLKERENIKDENGIVKEFSINPYKVVQQYGYYYVIDYSNGEFANYRIDLITELFINSSYEKNYKVDFENYIKENPEMSYGELINVEFLSESDMIDEILRTFPSNPRLEKATQEKKIKVNLKSNINTIKKFALAFGDKVKIVAPKSLIENIRESIAILKDNYTETDNESNSSVSDFVTSVQNREKESCIIIFGQRVSSFESISCNNVSLHKNKVCEIALYYISMINYYIDNFELYAVFEDIMSFKFKLTINEKDVYTEKDFKKIIDKLDELENTENFLIELRYSGYVEGKMDLEDKEMIYYFGEKDIGNIVVQKLLDYSIKDNFIYEEVFSSSQYEGSSFTKFDNGIIEKTYINNQNN